jgi:glycosyltransferase involved in cell wall biosynthesis
MVSYTITVHNEAEELNLLLNYLLDRISVDDEVVIQSDSEKVTDEVEDVVTDYIDKFSNMVYVKFPLNNNFSDFKNNLKKHCSKKWIFNIDADEVPSEFLIENLHEILKDNDGVEIILVPRWNIVEGITDEHIKKWGWKFDEYERINWPDYQTRIYRNSDSINWKNKVHERLEGFEKYSAFPEEKEFSLLHFKTIDKQERQNDFYDKMVWEK